MELILESIWVIFLGFAAMFYLTFDIWKEKLPYKEKLNKVWKEQKFVIIFCFFGILCGIGLMINFYYIYPGNLLIRNIKLLTLIMLLFPIGWKDFKLNIIPNKLILFGMTIRILLLIVEMIVYSDSFFSIVKDILYALGIVLVFALLGFIVVKKGIGMGDIKLLFIMALYQGISGMFSSLFFSLLVAFFIAIYLLIRRKKTHKDTIPFAPAILLGTLISVTLTGL